MKKKLILVGLAAGAVLTMTGWHVNDDKAERDCDSVTVTTNIPDEDWFTGTATLTINGTSASTSQPGPLSVTFPLDADAPAGTASGTVTWSDSSEVEPVSADYSKAPGECAPDQTTTTTTPPVDKPEKPTPQVGTPVHRTRTPAYTPTPAGNAPPDHHGPPVKPAPKPGKLPFTGAGEQAAMLVAGFALVVSGGLLVRKVRLN